MSEGIRRGAIAFEIPLSRLAEVCVPKLICKFLRKEALFQSIGLRYQQIAYVSDIAESQDNTSISINDLARAFDCPQSRVKSALEHRLNPPTYREKDTALDPDHQQQILEWIRQNAERSIPLTKGEIKDYCISQFQVPITRSWANSFVLRRADGIVQTKSSPQEEQRLQVPRAFLESTIHDLNEHVDGCVVELVFNLDDVGISD
jgi:hypothetical protein